MLSYGLDPDLEHLLERDVDDLAKYNILRFLHDRPDVKGNYLYFAEALGLRPAERVRQILEELARVGLVSKAPADSEGSFYYGISSDPANLDLVDRLYRLSSSSFYGEIVERLAARSLHRVRRGKATQKLAESGTA